MALLNSDPFFLQAQADARANGVADRSSLKAARQRAVAQFGLAPNFSGIDASLLGPDFQSDLTPETLALAKSNTDAGLSTEARLQQAHQDAIRSITNALAGRGLLSSGESGFQLGREQQNFTRAEYDANQRLLDALSGYAGSYTNSQRQSQQQQYQAMIAALQNLIGIYGNGGGGATSGSGAQQQPTPSDYAPAPGSVVNAGSDASSYAIPGGATSSTGLLRYLGG